MTPKLHQWYKAQNIQHSFGIEHKAAEQALNLPPVFAGTAAEKEKSEKDFHYDVKYGKRVGL